jgi:UDP-N-acetylglucosamine 2-epimerase (non-hydrolysing)
MVNQLKSWSYPEGYGDLDVSDKVIKVVLGGMKGV